MISRTLSRSRVVIFVLFIIFSVTVTVVYFYIKYLQEENSVEWSEQRCFSELRSVKYQLNVTEYKNRIDKLLTETQKAQETEKEKFKEIMESCVAMKQQTAICQNQFEDLQSECKTVRDDYNKLLKEQKRN
ncbi:uncharacterized protein LOC131853075 isoform X2 [Achroia grisella]|uniref:uncharacterized protein LOC131853075 isoform X2 n=1 Tax=Achroia grisella TaxID=688607 RepID=UPI0027D31406|nr:uncharacterized protein LOC131853075 isoform X2 [Achroia grisella]